MAGVISTRWHSRGSTEMYIHTMYVCTSIYNVCTHTYNVCTCWCCCWCWCMILMFHRVHAMGHVLVKRVSNFCRMSRMPDWTETIRTAFRPTSLTSTVAESPVFIDPIQLASSYRINFFFKHIASNFILGSACRYEKQIETIKLRLR